MPGPNVTVVYRTSSLEAYPEYEADYDVDDPSPTTVTICSTGGIDPYAAERVPSEVTTAWISCDAGHAVPMESIR